MLNQIFEIFLSPSVRTSFAFLLLKMMAFFYIHVLDLSSPSLFIFIQWKCMFLAFLEIMMKCFWLCGKTRIYFEIAKCDGISMCNCMCMLVYVCVCGWVCVMRLFCFAGTRSDFGDDVRFEGARGVNKDSHTTTTHTNTYVHKHVRVHILSIVYTKHRIATNPIPIGKNSCCSSIV